MENFARGDNYLALLEIRKKAFYRNLWIAGGLLFFAILATTGTLLVTAWNAQSIWLMGIFDLLFTISFLMAWTRYEMTRNMIEMVKNLYVQN